jgi:acetamidase/formamidase
MHSHNCGDLFGCGEEKGTGLVREDLKDAVFWILLGLDKDLNVAMTMAARNAIKFLSSRAGMTELDAYALCSIAVSFRGTQVVDIVRGVHAMIPRNLFLNGLREKIAVV